MYKSLHKKYKKKYLTAKGGSDFYDLREVDENNYDDYFKHLINYNKIFNKYYLCGKKKENVYPLLNKKIENAIHIYQNNISGRIIETMKVVEMVDDEPYVTSALTGCYNFIMEENETKKIYIAHYQPSSYNPVISDITKMIDKYIGSGEHEYNFIYCLPSNKKDIFEKYHNDNSMVIDYNKISGSVLQKVHITDVKWNVGKYMQKYYGDYNLINVFRPHYESSVYAFINNGDKIVALLFPEKNIATVKKNIIKLKAVFNAYVIDKNKVEKIIKKETVQQQKIVEKPQNDTRPEYMKIISKEKYYLEPVGSKSKEDMKKIIEQCEKNGITSRILKNYATNFMPSIPNVPIDGQRESFSWYITMLNDIMGPYSPCHWKIFWDEFYEAWNTQLKIIKDQPH